MILVIDFYNQKFSNNYERIDSISRESIKKICNHVFIENISSILDELDRHQIKQLAELFSNWMDYILPLSIIATVSHKFSASSK